MKGHIGALEALIMFYFLTGQGTIIYFFSFVPHICYELFYIHLIELHHVIYAKIQLDGEKPKEAMSKNRWEGPRI